MTILGFDRTDVRRFLSLFRLALADRFLGSRLGIAWAVLGPLSLLGIFVLVFTFVFPSRLPGSNDPMLFVLWLISGYGPWLAINEGISTATASVVGNAGIVRNIAFKSELLPFVGAAMGLFPLLVSSVILAVLMIVHGQAPGGAILIVPFVVIVLFVFVAGIGLFLSALQVFFRDTLLILPTILTLALFASPIFYPITAYPPTIQALVKWNPLYVLAECFRRPILSGEVPELWMLAYITILSGAILAAGLWWFRRLRFYFDSRM
jgi:ABC-type polysaccharide/polyol phosphate export permease